VFKFGQQPAGLVMLFLVNLCVHTCLLSLNKYSFRNSVAIYPWSCSVYILYNTYLNRGITKHNITYYLHTDDIKVRPSQAST